MSAPCIEGGRLVRGSDANGPPYRLVDTPDLKDHYQTCRADSWRNWTWQAADPACGEVGGWCDALASRSILFVGDSVTMQHVWSLIHLAGTESEQRAAVRGSEADFRRRSDVSLCGGRARINYIRNDLLASKEWDPKCRYSTATGTICRDFTKRVQGYNTLVLNTGLHTLVADSSSARAGRVANASHLFAQWLGAATRRRHIDVIWRTAVAGHEGCRRVNSPLDAPYTPPDTGLSGRYHWPEVGRNDAIWQAALREALAPRPLRILDAAALSNRRADLHLGRKRKFGSNKVVEDCLHYCLPGPPDDWSLVLKRMLLQTSAEPAPVG